MARRAQEHRVLEHVLPAVTQRYEMVKWRALEPVEFERPLITAPKLCAYAPPGTFDSPATVVARMTIVPRFPSPKYTSKQADDPVCAAMSAIDRPDALMRLVQMGPSRMLTWMQSCAQLRGCHLRDGRAVLSLLEHPVSALRDTALAAAALLGLPGATGHAHRLLEAHAPELNTVLGRCMHCLSA